MFLRFLIKLEFIAATIDYQETFQSEVTLKKAFKTFDKNNDGKISADELMATLGSNTNFGDKPIEFWAQMIKEVDVNGDGEVSCSFLYFSLSNRSITMSLLR